MAKERRTINVSLQSKKYLEPINQILNEWEDESLNLSTQICETLLQMKKLKSSGTFSSVLAVYELIERVMKVYDIQDHAQLERLFAEAVTINHSKLGKMITNLNPELPQPENKIQKPKVEKTEQVATPKIKPAAPAAIENEIKPVIQEVDALTESQEDDNEIPLDFLMNS
jgi:iron-sulfur cluster repair protein YtfE (RIC family)